MREQAKESELIFDNIISLGYWCGPALELRRIGRRKASYPFDWLIVDFPEVIRLITTGFGDFLSEGNLAQYSDNSEYYCDIVHNVHFYHDFNGYESLCVQLNDVNAKYNRRIQRFYEAISTPTLFIRYVRDEEECMFIKENISDIYAMIKSACQQNDICFVGKVDYEKYAIPNFWGGVSDNKVIDDFMDKIPGIKEYVINCSKETPTLMEVGRKNMFVERCLRKIKKKFRKNYVHNKIYHPAQVRVAEGGEKI